jgi:hypothetical protein
LDKQFDENWRGAAYHYHTVENSLEQAALFIKQFH